MTQHEKDRDRPRTGSTSPRRPAPVPAGTALDARALATLAEDAGPEAATRFATRYSAMLPRRVRRVLEAVDARDEESAMEWVLSLKVSSTTVGTIELAGLATDLEADVVALDWAHAGHTCEQLPDAARRACGALGELLAG